MSLKTSNENIVFIYLRSKQELLLLDRRLKDLEKFVEDKLKRATSKGGLPPQAGMLVEMLRKVTGDENLSLEKVVGDTLQQWETKIKSSIVDHMKIRASIMKDLQVAYDLISEQEPALVEKYDLLLKDNWA